MNLDTSATYKTSNISRKMITELPALLLACLTFSSCVPQEVITAYPANPITGQSFETSNSHCQLWANPSECLELEGWQPILQFVTYQQLEQNSLINSINYCNVNMSSRLSGTETAILSGAATLLISLKNEDSDSFTRFEECLKPKGWLLISEKRWVDSGQLIQAITPLLAPADPEILAPVIRDESLAIYWAADIADKALLLNYAEAIAFIRNMNLSAHADRTDWRLPAEDELRILERSTAVAEKLLNPRRISNSSISKLQGPYWAASGQQPDNAVSLVIPGGERMTLPNTRPYVARLLPVSGKGWNSKPLKDADNNYYCQLPGVNVN
jgi:hypothetical protein